MGILFKDLRPAISTWKYKDIFYNHRLVETAKSCNVLAVCYEKIYDPVGTTLLNSLKQLTVDKFTINDTLVYTKHKWFASINDFIFKARQQSYKRVAWSFPPPIFDCQEMCEFFVVVLFLVDNLPMLDAMQGVKVKFLKLLKMFGAYFASDVSKFGPDHVSRMALFTLVNLLSRNIKPDNREDMLNFIASNFVCSFNNKNVQEQLRNDLRTIFDAFKRRTIVNSLSDYDTVYIKQLFGEDETNIYVHLNHKIKAYELTALVQPLIESRFVNLIVMNNCIEAQNVFHYDQNRRLGRVRFDVFKPFDLTKFVPFQTPEVFVLLVNMMDDTIVCLRYRPPTYLRGHNGLVIKQDFYTLEQPSIHKQQQQQQTSTPFMLFIRHLDNLLVQDPVDGPVIRLWPETSWQDAFLMFEMYTVLLYVLRKRYREMENPFEKTTISLENKDICTQQISADSTDSFLAIFDKTLFVTYIVFNLLIENRCTFKPAWQPILRANTDSLFALWASMSQFAFFKNELLHKLSQTRLFGSLEIRHTHHLGKSLFFGPFGKIVDRKWGAERYRYRKYKNSNKHTLQMSTQYVFDNRSSEIINMKDQLILRRADHQQCQDTNCMVCFIFSKVDDDKDGNLLLLTCKDCHRHVCACLEENTNGYHAVVEVAAALEDIEVDEDISSMHPLFNNIDYHHPFEVEFNNNNNNEELNNTENQTNNEWC